MGSWLVIAEANVYAVPAAALIVSAAALVYGAMGGHRQSRDREMADLRDELRECRSQRSALERENIALMRQLTSERKENGT